MKKCSLLCTLYLTFWIGWAAMNLYQHGYLYQLILNDIVILLLLLGVYCCVDIQAPDIQSTSFMFNVNQWNLSFVKDFILALTTKQYKWQIFHWLFWAFFFSFPTPNWTCTAKSNIHLTRFKHSTTTKSSLIWSVVWKEMEWKY